MNTLLEGMTPTLIRVIDVETTGLEPEDQIVELGWTDIDITTPGEPLIGEAFPQSGLVNPGRPIPPEASAVHHITDALVREAPPIDHYLARLMPRPAAHAAHNARFDRQFLDLAGDWICTYKAALVAWPDAPGHSNQVLRYWLGLDLPSGRCQPPHRAGPDSFVTAHLLALLLRRFSLAELVEITARPALLPRVTFGKHEGARWEDVPSDYLRWMLGTDMDEDRKHTARHHLGLRGEL